MTEIPDQRPDSAAPGSGLQRPSLPPPTIIQMPAPKRSRVAMVILTLMLIASVLVNLVLFVSLTVSSVAALTGRGSSQLEETVISCAAVETKDKIAVIRVEGMITENGLRGLMGRQATSRQFVRRQLQQAAADKNVKGVILKVNSPGGGAAASDLIYHDLKMFEKPIVVHFGSLAASGGYYVGMAGRAIIAQPTCLTGSIGVIGQLVTVRELMEEKLGIKVHTLKSGQYKDAGNPFREMTEAEQAYLRETLIEPVYQRFLDVIRSGRPNLSETEIRRWADGRIFSAQQALDAGLIDRIGYFEDAVEEAMAESGIAAANVVEYRIDAGLFDVLGLAAERQSDSLLNLSPEMLTAWTTPQVMMLWQGR
jgi:protease IV